MIRVVTPGSITDEQEVEGKRNLYMAAISGGPMRSASTVRNEQARDFKDGQRQLGRDEIYGLAHMDLSTGEFRVTEVRLWNELINELGRIDPAEVLIVENERLSGRKELSNYRVEIVKKDVFDPPRAKTLLKEQFGVSSLSGFGLQDMPQGIIYDTSQPLSGARRAFWGFWQGLQIHPKRKWPKESVELMLRLNLSS